MLSPDQFPGIEYPFPRIRHAYAVNWAKNYSDMLNSEGENVHWTEAYPHGLVESEHMVRRALGPDREMANFARKHLYNHGFLKRGPQ